ncbi:hypothetical protein SAMN05192559_10471 [Halobacillus karajensis]|uniref:hypothetical protein n=1 Tax=Halobacillus karajensis TaxID=195088 RepID=UPI0008A78BD0|nr:hypothetical protein [Halobacillus karajensis]SEH77920.1 hypothetical protein SAMN05192559_10471 [Halobacillus karajensis]
MSKTYDDTLTTYKMDEDERRRRMAVNPLNYIEMKEKGWSDAKIAEQWGMHPPDVSKKKDSWDFIGRSLDEMKKIAKKNMSKAQRNKAQSHSMQDQIKEEVQEKEAEKDVQNSKLEKVLEEVNGEIKRLNQIKGDLEEKLKTKSLKLEQISKEYEALENKYRDLEEQFDVLQEQSSSPKQTVLLVEKQLNEEKQAHQITQLKVEHLQREKQVHLNQIEILTNNNERFQRQYREAQKTHEALAAYTQLVMPS